MLSALRGVYRPLTNYNFLFVLKSNLLEASPEMMQRDSEKEWYYGNKEKERLGPFSFKEVSFRKENVMVFFVKTYAERTSRQNRTDLRS